MNAIISRKFNMLAAAIAVSLATAIGTLSTPVAADSGDVTSGKPDVSNVLGRSSTNSVPGNSIKTGGLSIAVYGRSTGQSGDPAMSKHVSARPAEGALAWAGRGSQPTYAINAKSTSSASIAANAR